MYDFFCTKYVSLYQKDIRKVFSFSFPVFIEEMEYYFQKKCKINQIYTIFFSKNKNIAHEGIFIIIIK
jgi:hypothetical protein